MPCDSPQCRGVSVAPYLHLQYTNAQITLEDYDKSLYYCMVDSKAAFTVEERVPFIRRNKRKRPVPWYKLVTYGETERTAKHFSPNSVQIPAEYLGSKHQSFSNEFKRR